MSDLEVTDLEPVLEMSNPDPDLHKSQCHEKVLGHLDMLDDCYLPLQV